MKKWTCSSSVPGGLHSFRRISVSRHDPGYAAEHRFSWIDASRKLPEPIHSDSRIMSELRRKKNLKESGLYKNRGSCRKSFRIWLWPRERNVCCGKSLSEQARTTIVRHTTTVTEPVPPSRSAMTNLMVKGDFKPQAVRVCPSQKRLR